MYPDTSVRFPLRVKIMIKLTEKVSTVVIQG